VKPSQPIGDYLDALVHPSARQDVLTAARHRAFIAPRLVGSLLALAALPVFLAVSGVPSVLEFIVLAWMVVPIATAGYLSRTGRYEGAHVISALALTAIAIAVTAYSGGVDSIAAIWLVLIPLEAAVSGSRRVVAVAAVLALGGAVLLTLVDSAVGVSVAARHAGVLAALGIVSPLLYAIGIALGAERIARTNSRLLDAQEDRWRLVACHMTDVITHHGDGGRVLLASTNAYAVLGIAAGELQGLGLFDRVHIGDRPAFLTALSDASARGLAGSVEFRFRQPKLGDEAGRFAWIEMQCKPLDLPGRPNGEARDVVAVMREVSRQRAQQQALVDARAEAERSNAAKSRFLAIMSHELRTPLNAVIGFSEMLANAEQLSIDRERRQEYVRLINDAGCHLLEVVNDILDVSRLETGDFKIVPEPFEPAAVIEGCRELLALKAKDQGVTLRLRAPPELPDVVGDKRAVKQILINLVANGLKFTDRGGTVTIDAAVDRDHLVVSVEDTGIGIAPEHVGRLGDAFFQVRGSYARTHDGAGLGLSIVKGLVKLHGGDVAVRSRVGEGTRVTVRLPLDCECQRKPEPEPIRQFVRPVDAEFPHMPPFAAAIAPRFKPAVQKSA
jgi:two-component system, cell cycle sensor histidine kinase DivJ